MKSFIGCAGWSISKENARLFDSAGTHLERYARVFNAVEINSCFYRSHQCSTYTRWASSVPAGFRFSVKVPKLITHTQRLVETESLVNKFISEVTSLREKLGVILVQLPPSLPFEHAVVAPFFHHLKLNHRARITLEARHPSWFSPNASKLLREMGVGRVIADPPIRESGGEPVSTGICYFRLHGAPQIYYSNYDSALLKVFAERMKLAARHGAEVWAIFDNTALGHALPNAVTMKSLLTTTGAESELPIHSGSENSTSLSPSP